MYYIDKVLLLTIIFIYVILIFASIIILLLIKKYPHRDFTELVNRIKSWWIMITIFSISILSNTYISLFFFSFISFLALKEYFSIIPIRKTDRHLIFIAYLAIIIQYYFVSTLNYMLFITFIPLYLFIFLQIRLSLMGKNKNFHYSITTLMWGLIMFLFFLSHLGYLLMLPNLDNFQIGGVGLVLFLVFLTQFNDVSQYVWGKLLGKRKIVPNVSENKTWKGFLGGILNTTLLSLLLFTFLTPLSFSMAIVAGLIISIGGFLGDVTLSALKRDLGIKDSSQLLPGHGGILDRIDSLVYTAPLFFHFIYYLYY